ncbi:MAG: L-seryl-tRNA(Sec) selenium transferase [Actinomycetota bacterium]|nr:L-seryl-tRNA(Sec) selenium transferase [Actinomycetota bacterium]
MSDRFRSLPPVDRVAEALGDGEPRSARVGAARRAVDLARDRIRAGAPEPSFEDVVATAVELLGGERRMRLGPVINATGVLIHTNLGRVPLGDAQLAEVARVAGGYSNLEYDLSSGERGSRYAHSTHALTALTGGEAALVVNNNAAAVLLCLAALCSGREVIISRGELVEIGGEFRIPDVMAASGAKLVEVGTTNRTHLSDYERAITPATAAILIVHPSNYQVVGFTAEVPARELARLAMGRGVNLIHDIGSGLVRSPDPSFAGSDPLVESAVADGADLVTFSGDKLLGGPQCGIIVGREKHVAKLRAHPLLRAMRPDKMTLAALDATLRLYREDREQELPLFQMAGVGLEELERRARTIAEALRERLELEGVKVDAIPTRAAVGGGAMPGTELGSWGVTVRHPDRSAAEIGRSLRHGDVPIVARVEDDTLVLDVRTMLPSDDERVVALLLVAVGAV